MARKCRLNENPGHDAGVLIQPPAWFSAQELVMPEQREQQDDRQRNAEKP
jgi:hypothetical protein